MDVDSDSSHVNPASRSRSFPQSDIGHVDPASRSRSFPKTMTADAIDEKLPRCKRSLESCRIEGHKIQKRLSPRKKALDPLRYLPDGGGYYALFTVAAYFEEEGAEQRRHVVQRSYKQFSTLHARLLKTYPKSNVPHDLPSMRNKRYDNEYIEEKRNELTTYLAQLMLIPEVKASTVLREFLEAPASVSDSSDDEDGLVMPSRMLEGLPGTIVTVRAGQSFSVTLPLNAAGDLASWQFTTKKHNIGFSATFEGETIRAYSREGADVKPIKGFYRCTAPGTCTLTWDNTYTWSKAKVLIYWAEVESQTSSSQQNGQLASTSSPSQDGSVSADGSDSGAVDVDNRRLGFIEHSRSNTMHPRHIVNSSISLITKPFAHGHGHGHGGDDDGSSPGKTRTLLSRRTSVPTVSTCSELPGSDHSILHGKAGSLIIQRSVKFRGRNWYRKWFVLDPKKCILRYYDSEAAARRGLSLAKLNLTNKHASLAITSSLSLDAAPTPYMFLIRTKKHCWKICASSQNEYNEWENAISTAILTAQLSRRGRSSKKAMLKARKKAVRKGSHTGEDSPKPEAHADATDSSMATMSSSLTPDRPLSPIEESDDDDDEDFASKGDGESDSDSDDESESDSDEELHEDDTEGIIHSEVNTTSTLAVGTAASGQLPDLHNLPMEWKFGMVAVVNVALLSVRSAPAAIIVLVLFVTDWYLLLNYLKGTMHASSEDNLLSPSKKAKTE